MAIMDTINALIPLAKQPIQCEELTTDSGSITVAIATNGWTGEKLENYASKIDVSHPCGMDLFITGRGEETITVVCTESQTLGEQLQAESKLVANWFDSITSCLSA